MSLDNLKSITENPKFDANKPTTMFLHGYHTNQSSSAVVEIVNAYITYGGHNLIVLDWAKAASSNYLVVSRNVEPVKFTICIDNNYIDRMREIELD